MCRYRIDGQPHEWEEVFRFNDLVRLKRTISEPTLTNAGDVYFSIGIGSDAKFGIWWFDATSKKIEQLIANTEFHLYEHPRVSPNGKWVAFVRKGKDGAKLMLLPRSAK
jgi:hypothetical protein